VRQQNWGVTQIGQIIGKTIQTDMAVARQIFFNAGVENIGRPKPCSNLDEL